MRLTLDFDVNLLDRPFHRLWLLDVLAALCAWRDAREALAVERSRLALAGGDGIAATFIDRVVATESALMRLIDRDPS